MDGPWTVPVSPERFQQWLGARVSRKAGMMIPCETGDLRLMGTYGFGEHNASGRYERPEAWVVALPPQAVRLAESIRTYSFGNDPFYDDQYRLIRFIMQPIGDARTEVYGICAHEAMRDYYTSLVAEIAECWPPGASAGGDMIFNGPTNIYGPAVGGDVGNLHSAPPHPERTQSWLHLFSDLARRGSAAIRRVWNDPKWDLFIAMGAAICAGVSFRIIGAIPMPPHSLVVDGMSWSLVLIACWAYYQYTKLKVRLAPKRISWWPLVVLGIISLIVLVGLGWCGLQMLLIIGSTSPTTVTYPLRP